MIKMFEADMKRLKGILVTYEEKVKDLSAHELEQRNEVLDLLRQSLKLLKDEIEEQTRNFQHGFVQKPINYLDETIDPSAVNPTDSYLVGREHN